MTHIAFVLKVAAVGLLFTAYVDSGGKWASFYVLRGVQFLYLLAITLQLSDRVISN